MTIAPVGCIVALVVVDCMLSSAYQEEYSSLITHPYSSPINTKKVTTLNIILFLSTLQECEWAPNSGGKWWTSSAWSAGVMAESPILRNGIWMMFHNNSSAFDEFLPIKTKNHLEPVVIAGLVANDMSYIMMMANGKEYLQSWKLGTPYVMLTGLGFWGHGGEQQAAGWGWSQSC